MELNGIYRKSAHIWASQREGHTGDIVLVVVGADAGGDVRVDIRTDSGNFKSFSEIFCL